MHLTLLVPGLLWPAGILRDTTFDLSMPALALLLGRGRRSPVAAGDAWLASAFGLPPLLPAAPLRLLGDGGQPGEGDWLCLDPVHLRIAERAVLLDDPAALALAPGEDEALRSAVAPLLAAFGDIVALRAGRWYLRLSRGVELDVPALPDALGRAVDPGLPAGRDGPAWRRLLAEIQPLLHAQEVNRRREAAGLPAVNSLWPWGGGRLPATLDCAYRRLWTGEPVTTGLGVAAGLVVEPLPARFAAAPGPVLARLDSLATAQAGSDALVWREAFAALERDWLSPALAALRSGRCRGLCLIGTGHGSGLRLDVRRRDLWRVWRRPLALAEAVS